VGQWNASDRGQVAQLYTLRIASIKRLAIADNSLMPRCRRGKSTTRREARVLASLGDCFPEEDLEESFKEVIKITSALYSLYYLKLDEVTRERHILQHRNLRRCIISRIEISAEEWREKERERKRRRRDVSRVNIFIEIFIFH